MFYLLPLLSVIALVFAVLSLSKKLDAKFASLALGAIILGFSSFAGVQARAQLDSFVYMQYEMQAKRVEFDARRTAIEKIINEDFPSSTDSAKPTPPAAVPEVKPIVIAEADTSTWGPGFYLSIVASLLLLASGGLSLKARKDEIVVPL